MSSATTSLTSSSNKSIATPKRPLSKFDNNNGKRKLKHSELSTSQISLSSVLMESMNSLPLTIFDFNGSPEYYEHMSPFIDINALHLICIHTLDFDRITPKNIEEIFDETFDVSSFPLIQQLFQILQLLCEKLTKTKAILILPIATCIDLYDKQPKQNK